VAWPPRAFWILQRQWQEVHFTFLHQVPSPPCKDQDCLAPLYSDMELNVGGQEGGGEGGDVRRLVEQNNS